jgi:transcriptional regulator with XRE-family HTH domain
MRSSQIVDTVPVRERRWNSIGDRIRGGNAVNDGTQPQPTVSRIHLGQRLRELREQRGFTQAQVAEAMDWSPSKVIRIEAGTCKVGVTDLRAMLMHFQVTDQDVIHELMALARAGRVADWRTPYRKHVSPQQYSYLDFEAAAARIWLFTSGRVPGLLCSPAYARAYARIFHTEEEARERDVAIIMQRQRILTVDARAPEMTFLLDMAVLQREVGDAGVMREQLRHLGVLATHPRMTIRLVPFDAGAHPGLRGCAFAGLDLPAAPSVVFIDRPRGVAMRNKPSEVEQLRGYFDAIAECALPVEATAGAIADVLAEL